MNGRTPLLLALLAFAALVALAQTAAADEIRLKDGSKIIGTIVGYEDGSFKVQTSYGFALVRKDRVAAIVPSETKPEPKSAAKKETAPEKKLHAGAPAAGNSDEPASNPASAKQAGQPVPAVAANAQPAAAPPPEPAEPPMREEVQGNLYINHTYGFRMFKPPGWHVIEGAPKAVPTAIVAMGTADETTLLVVGRESLTESLEKQAAGAEKQLQEIYTNYRRLAERRTKVAGLPAVERRYRGTVDAHDWSGVLLSLARGNEVFTILGMTYADSDLIQIQENVILKTIASIEFTTK